MGPTWGRHKTMQSLFTNRTDVSPPALAKPPSREFGYENYDIVLKFHMRIGYTVAEMPVEFRNDWAIVNPYPGALRLYKNLVVRRLLYSGNQKQVVVCGKVSHGNAHGTIWYQSLVQYIYIYIYIYIRFIHASWTQGNKMRAKLMIPLYHSIGERFSPYSPCQSLAPFQ